MRRRPRRRKVVAWSGEAAWLLALALSVFLLDAGPLASRGWSLTGYHDNASFNDPLRVEAARQWSDGRVPLWNPYSLAGSPLLGTGGDPENG